MTVRDLNNMYEKLQQDLANNIFSYVEWLELGVAYEKEGRREKSMEIYKRAVREHSKRKVLK